MFDYTVCTQADVELFHKQCTAIEKNIPNLEKQELLEDVDGTLSQQYNHTKGSIARFFEILEIRFLVKRISWFMNKRDSRKAVSFVARPFMPKR